MIEFRLEWNNPAYLGLLTQYPNDNETVYRHTHCAIALLIRIILKVGSWELGVGKRHFHVASCVLAIASSLTKVDFC